MRVSKTMWLLFGTVILLGTGIVFGGIVGTPTCNPSSCFDEQTDTGSGSRAYVYESGDCDPQDYYSSVWLEAEAETYGCNGMVSRASLTYDGNGLYGYASVWGFGYIPCLYNYGSSNCDGSGSGGAGAFSSCTC